MVCGKFILLTSFIRGGKGIPEGGTGGGIDEVLVDKDGTVVTAPGPALDEVDGGGERKFVDGGCCGGTGGGDDDEEDVLVGTK